MLLLISSVYLVDAGGHFIPRQRSEHLLTRWNASVQSNIIVEFDLSYDFSVPGETHRINFIVVLPKTIPDRQSILSINYSPKPSRIFHKNGNRYAEFVFIKPSRKVKIEINIRAELFRYDLLTARKKRKKDRPQDYQLKAFLKQEKHIEKDHYQIQEIADGIEGQTEIDIVKNIYDYVIDNMEYTIRSRGSWGAVKALQHGKGDCTEYADLFVAICRAKNIPTRVVTGYTAGVDPTSSKHNWAEVYLQEYGWVPFDPSTGDKDSVIIRNRAFGRMRPAYIYLSYIRNDEVLHNYNFSLYRYWGDRVRFKDSIEFKRPASPL